MNILASSSYDDTIRIYQQDIAGDEWSCVGILNGHEGTVWCSKFESLKSPIADSSVLRLVSASDDLSVRIWIAKREQEDDEQAKLELPSSIRHTNEMVWEVESVLPSVHKYPVYSVAWSALTGKIASAGPMGRLLCIQKPKRKWVIDSIHEGAHGVHEINCVIWAQLDDEMKYW